MTTNIDNKVYSDAGRQYWGTWIFAIFWNALISYAIIKGGENILKAFASNPITYLFALFPLLGVWLIVLAIMQTLSWRKFGKTPLILDPFPGQIGGYFSGYLDLPLSSAEASHSKVILSCIHSTIRHRKKAKRYHHISTLWQDAVAMQPTTLGNKIRLNFAFKPPYELPASETESDNYHYWRLHVRVPRSGLDYDRTFKVPMQKADGQTLSANTTTKPPPSSTIIPTHREVPVIRKTLAGTEFYYGYGRSKFFAILLICMAVFITGFGHFFFTDFMSFLPATTMLMATYVYLIALALLLLGIFLIASSLTIEVSLMGIRKQQRILGYQLEDMSDAKNIVDIQVKQNSSSTQGHETRIWYCLKLIHADGTEIEVGDSLEGQRYAEEIKQQMLDELGMNWRPATLQQPIKKTKKPLPPWLKWTGKILSYGFIFALLFDLNKVFPEILQFLKTTLSNY